MRKYEIFGLKIDDISTEELLRCLSNWLQGIRPRVIVTPNPEFLMLARRDVAFRELLNRADLALPDGVGLRFAIPALTGKLLSYRHTGVDTLVQLARACAASEKSLALFGGDAGVAELAAQRLRALVPGLFVVGIDPGIINHAEIESSTVRRLEGFSVIAVGLGQGKQERVMEFLRVHASPSLRVLIGVGGAFDMLSGMKRRAPAWMRAIGLEWIWRAVIEPSRIRRIFMAFPGFPALVIWDTLKHRRFMSACRAAIPEIFRQLRGL